MTCRRGRLELPPLWERLSRQAGASHDPWAGRHPDGLAYAGTCCGRRGTACRRFAAAVQRCRPSLRDVPAQPPLLPEGLQALQALAAGREVVVFDNARAGLSNDSATGPLSVEGMAASTMQLLRALQLGRPDVLGFSLGGMVALQMAASYSNELGAVVSGAGRRARAAWGRCRACGGSTSRAVHGGKHGVARCAVMGCMLVGLFSAAPPCACLQWAALLAAPAPRSPRAAWKRCSSARCPAWLAPVEATPSHARNGNARHGTAAACIPRPPRMAAVLPNCLPQRDCGGRPGKHRPCVPWRHERHRRAGPALAQPACTTPCQVGMQPMRTSAPASTD